ncbi:hemicentin-2-like [Crassostrea virginica]
MRTDNTNSTILMIMDVAEEDAGFYGWGNDSAEALSRPGVVLIVHKKPLMPTIEGTLSVRVGSTTQLTCSGKSTSVPDYYSKLNILEFSWFINDTELFRESRETLIVNVTKKSRFDRFSCTASDMIESNHSNGVHIDPLYGPAEVIFVPQPNKMNGTLLMSIKEGDNFGPSQCLADCNPPCNMTWRYKDSTGFVDVASNGGELLSQKVKRDMVFFSCIAEGRIGTAAKGSIFLEVIYMEFPIFDVYRENEIKLQTTDVKEGKVLQLSCFVEGNPTPKVQISKVHKSRDIVLLESNGHWSNYSFKREVTCLDSGVYACSARTEELQSKRNEIFLNILCDPRYQRSDRIEVFNGAMIGLEKAVIVKIPVTSNPPPLISNVSWIGPDDQMINDTSVLSRWDNDNPYSHMIISIVPIPEFWQYGEYRILYNGYCLINITIDENDVNMLESKVERNGNNRLYMTGLLMSTILLAVLGTFFLGVVIYLLYSRRKQTNPKNVENPTETAVYETPRNDPYTNVNSIENHTYSEIGIKLREQNI